MAASDEKKITPVDRMMMVTVQAHKQTIEKVMPKDLGMDLDRFEVQVRLALNKNPALLACTPTSIVQSVVTAAELGLDPSGRLGSGYLVPYKDTCQFIPGYRGLIDLAARSGEVATIRAEIVFWGDEFDYELGDRPRLHHKRATPQTPEEARTWKKKTADDVRAAYCVSEMKNKAKQFTVMERWELDLIKARSPGARSGKSPWNHPDDILEMYRKCPVRKHVKTLPLSPSKAKLLARAIEIDPDEPGSEGETELNDRFPAKETTTTVKPSKADQIKGKLGTEEAKLACGSPHPTIAKSECVLDAGHTDDGAAHEDAAGNIW